MGDRKAAVRDERRAEDILCAWANFVWKTDTVEAGLARLASRWPEVFRDPIGRKIAGDDIKWFIGIRKHLREAWDERDQKAREWYVYKVRDLYATAINDPEKEVLELLGYSARSAPVPSDTIELGKSMIANMRRQGLVVDDPPRDVPFERIMYHFQRRLRSALHCANPDCPAPYYFKEDGVRTQKYCCEDCSQAARKDSQDRYWHEKGKQRRKKSAARKKGRPK